jgi:hypothetical protein
VHDVWNGIAGMGIAYRRFIWGRQEGGMRKGGIWIWRWCLSRELHGRSGIRRRRRDAKVRERGWGWVGADEEGCILCTLMRMKGG